jgi:hypothetical protein
VRDQTRLPAGWTHESWVLSIDSAKDLFLTVALVAATIVPIIGRFLPERLRSRELHWRVHNEPQILLKLDAIVAPLARAPFHPAPRPQFPWSSRVLRRHSNFRGHCFDRHNYRYCDLRNCAAPMKKSRAFMNKSLENVFSQPMRTDVRRVDGAFGICHNP